MSSVKCQPLCHSRYMLSLKEVYSSQSCEALIMNFQLEN